MRMNRKSALAAGASLGIAFLAACSDSPTAPAVPLKPSLATGAVTNTVPTAVPGKLVVCKTGNVGGTFVFTRTTEGANIVGSSIVSSPQTIATGTCLEVANDDSPSGNGSHITVTEQAAANTTFQVTACQFRGYDITGTVIQPPVTCTYVNGTDLFLNHFHGYVITYTNTFTQPPAGCTFTQGYYKNHESVVAQLLSTNGGFVVGGKLVLSQDGTLALTAAQIDENLGTPPKGGDAFLILTHQLITAELNVKGGASTPTAVANAITAARLLLNGGISAAEEDQAKALADILDAFNNSITGPGHCDD